MSFYATISGSLEYEKQEDFDKALLLLVDGKQSNDEYLLDERGNPIDCEEKQIDKINRTITLPIDLYRNLARILDKLIIGSKGCVIWTSTDGCFSGGVITDGEETEYDLETWAKENDLGEGPSVDDMEKYVAWSNEVEQAFFEEMS